MNKGVRDHSIDLTPMATYLGKKMLNKRTFTNVATNLVNFMVKNSEYVLPNRAAQFDNIKVTQYAAKDNSYGVV